MASDQAPKLQPCRHCGCTDVRLRKTERLVPWFVECFRGSCGANIGYRETAAEAVAAWNRSADASPLPPPGSAAERLVAVQTTIANMALLPHDHDCYLRPSLAERALSVLSEITVPPKIISGPEAITFTWVVGGGKIYLTVSEDDLDIMMIAEGRRTDARATLPPPEEGSAAELGELAADPRMLVEEVDIYEAEQLVVEENAKRIRAIPAPGKGEGRSG